jgi:UDPglucose 6-dehydrogenase
MNIAVIGTGYVGLVTGTMLAEINHNVTCIDIDSRKIAQLQSCESPIYEPGLDQLLQKNSDKGRLRFTTEHFVAFKNADVIYIAVGTPQGSNGEADLTYIKQAACDIAQIIDHDIVVVIKSTVPPGTNDEIESLIREKLVHPISVDVVSNPEFLREGHAIHDAFHGDRIVIGSENDKAGDIVEKLYAPLMINIIRTNRRSAEMIKYAANAFLAVKISYINEIANLCDEIGADVTAVADGMGTDKRIGRSFLNAGIGYGGSCFPKDTEAIAYMARQKDMTLNIVESAIQINKDQRFLFVDKIVRFFNGDISNKKFAILGLAFKPDTDDMREAPSLTIMDELIRLGANVKAFDPVVSHEYSTNSIEESVNNVDAIILVTEWDNFLKLNWNQIYTLVKEKVIFDGRNALDAVELQQSGWTYIGVGKERRHEYEFLQS